MEEGWGWEVFHQGAGKAILVCSNLHQPAGSTLIIIVAIYWMRNQVPDTMLSVQGNYLILTRTLGKNAGFERLKDSPRVT